jgi:bifunctional NMN adenylyltransferase/nudix hydrolase
MKLAIVIGRFQPLHLGHMSLIDKAQKEADKVLILIGSSRQLPDYKNPFSHEERLTLIQDVYSASTDLIIRPLPDAPSDDEWISNVIGEVLSIEEDPTEVLLLTHEKDEDFYRTTFLFPVETVKDVPISATIIRHAWYQDTLWTVDAFIDSRVLEFLKTHKDLDRLSMEYEDTEGMCEIKTQGHPFGNPMEPVSFAAIIQGGKLLVGRRGGSRGRGQLGLAGGYVQNDETTMDGCIREVKEELGVDLASLILSNDAQCLAQAVEENMNDLGSRTLGINYLFVLKPDLELEITIDGEETTEFQWLPLDSVLQDKELLFYNHSLILKRLLSKVGEAK